jgi:hypothetical protein
LIEIIGPLTEMDCPFHVKIDRSSIEWIIHFNHGWTTLEMDSIGKKWIEYGLQGKLYNSNGLSYGLKPHLTPLMD